MGHERRVNNSEYFAAFRELNLRAFDRGYELRLKLAFAEVVLT